MQERYDIIISGGGLVGASLACALQPLGKRIAIIESFPIENDAQPSYDERVTAVAWGSKVIFEAMGVWQQMREASTPIEMVHVSEANRFGVTRLTAEDAAVDALGYVVPNRVIGRVLVDKLKAAANVDWYCPAKVVDFEVEPGHVSVTCTQDEKPLALHARLLVAADGARSVIRQRLEITPRVWDYAQTALVTTVTPSRLHRQVAYERFTREGPIAMLPLPDNRCGVVWTLKQELFEEIASLAEKEFCSRLGHAFGRRLGAFTRVGSRHHYPLQLVNTREQVRSRVLIVGNAAHSLHPIAGQGFNLSLRDVAVLADVMADAGEDAGEASLLSRYGEWRQADQRRMIAFTDGLNRLFRNPLVPLGSLRSMGLLVLDISPPLKRKLGNLTMGLGEDLPRLARGVALR